MKEQEKKNCFVFILNNIEKNFFCDKKSIIMNQSSHFYF